MAGEVTLQQLQNAALDCTTLQAVVNGTATAPPVISRLGTSIPTLAAAIAGVAAQAGTTPPPIIAPLVTFASGSLGTIDGSNRGFVLPQVPRLLFLFVNGLLQRGGTDYTLSGTSVVFTTAPQIGDILYAQGIV